MTSYPSSATPKRPLLRLFFVLATVLTMIATATPTPSAQAQDERTVKDDGPVLEAAEVDPTDEMSLEEIFAAPEFVERAEELGCTRVLRTLDDEAIQACFLEGMAHQEQELVPEIPQLGFEHDCQLEAATDDAFTLASDCLRTYAYKHAGITAEEAPREVLVITSDGEVFFGPSATESMADTALFCDGVLSTIQVTTGSDFIDASLSTIAINVHTWLGSDWVTGSPFDDRICGGGQQDILGGIEGNDYMHGGDTGDLLVGAEGNDEIWGGLGRDGILGGAGSDTIDGGLREDWIWGGDGDDEINGGAGPDILRGEGGRDVIRGGLGIDFILGGDGNDELHGGFSTDRIEGELGEDRIFGGAGRDWLFGGEHRDTIFGETGPDRIHGNEDDDELHGGNGADEMWGHDGNDDLFGNRGKDKLSGGNGNNDYGHGGPQKDLCDRTVEDPNSCAIGSW